LGYELSLDFTFEQKIVKRGTIGEEEHDADEQYGYEIPPRYVDLADPEAAERPHGPDPRLQGFSRMVDKVADVEDEAAESKVAKRSHNEISLLLPEHAVNLDEAERECD